jgi:hypothetical protein
MIHDYISRITTSAKLSALRNLVHILIISRNKKMSKFAISIPQSRQFGAASNDL